MVSRRASVIAVYITFFLVTAHFLWSITFDKVVMKDSEILERLVDQVEWDQVSCDASEDVAGKLRGVRDHTLCVLDHMERLPMEDRLYPDLKHGSHYPLNFNEEMRKRWPLLSDPGDPQSKRLWYESAWFTFILRSRGSRAFVHGGNGYVADSAGFGYRNNRWYHEFPENSKLVTLHTPVMSFCTKYGSSLPHFAMETLPKLAAALPWLQTHRNVRVLINNFSKSSEILLKLGLPAMRVQYADIATVYSAPYVVYVDYAAPTIDMGSPQPNACVAAAELLNNNLASGAGRKWTPAGHPSRNKVIYLSRGDKGVRGLKNHLEVLALGKLLKPGFELVVLNNPGATAAQDQAAMSEAAAVLGPHGEAWLNLMYLPPGIPVIEFNNLEDPARWAGTTLAPRPCYMFMAYCLGLKYYNVESPGFSYESGPFTVPIDKVQDRLHETGFM